MHREAHVEVDRKAYPSRGIDISAHNGEIDFRAVADAGIEFVYIKATEGASWLDARFLDNYIGATAAGLSVGVYHFFRFDVPAWQQAANLLQAIGSLDISLPVAIDVEEWTNPTHYTTEEVTDNLRSLIELLRLNGREPIIYTNKNGYYRFVRNRFDDVDLWICSFTTPPVADRKRWLLWQHSHKGTVPGVPSPVSFDTFNTPVAGPLSNWLGRHPAVNHKSIGQ